MNKILRFSSFLFPLFLLIGLVACTEKKASSSAKSSSISSNDQQPNVIYIMTDDQGYGDVGSHGNPILKTPHLDAFAKTAIEATNYHTGTTCTPTRAGLLTGRNSNRNGTWHTIAGCSILDRSEETMAEVFQKNNYKTALFGKWHLGDNYPYRPQDRGFEETFQCLGGGVGQTPDYWNNDYFDDTYLRNGQPEKVAGYCTDVWFDETIKFIDKNKDKPFFVYLTPNAAHGPFNVPKAYLAKYEDADLTPSLKRFYGMISNLDDNFKKLLNYLDTNNLSDNTIIVYTTDNGSAGGVTTDKTTGKKYGFNAGLREKKSSEYDGGHRVPFYIRYPNGQINGGKKTNELLAHVDILPTFVKMCNLDFTPKKPLDGKDCTAQIKGEKTDENRMLIIDTQRNQWPKKGQRSCVMNRDWRLIKGTELYHTKVDPGQTKNVASEHPERVKAMNDFYDQWWASTVPDFAYSPLIIGAKEENPTVITIHDMHHDDPIPWHQRNIRANNNKVVDGYYTVEVAAAGTYQFRLRRYPVESDLGLNAIAPEIPDQPHVSGLPVGQSLPIKKGTLEIGAVKVSVGANNDEEIVLTAELPAGLTKLKTWFELENGDKVHAFYHYIRKI